MDFIHRTAEGQILALSFCRPGFLEQHHPSVMQSSAPAPGTLSPWDSGLGAIEDSISQCTFLQRTYTAENPHADGSASPGARPLFRTPRRRDPHATSPAPTTTGWGKIDVLSSVNGSSTVVLQQRCHRTSASARSPSWPPMFRPRLQRAPTVRTEKIQLPIGNRISS
jgi:hypothetical protein